MNYMVISIAHLGPTGTYAETAALAYRQWLQENRNETSQLCPYPSIATSLYAVARQEVEIGMIPVENSTEGGIAITLDTLWEIDQLKIQHELILPIHHCLFCRGASLEGIKVVYSHPQALAQCQKWLEKSLPHAQLIPMNSTTEALNQINTEPTAAAISSPRAGKLYQVPMIANNINDYPDNCTRFWVVGLTPTTEGNRTSLAFSMPANIPGALVKPLEVFAKRGINLSRIESRPTKRSLGEYLFFIDIESSMSDPITQEALKELSPCTEIVKILGSYDVLTLESSLLADL